MKYSAMLLAMSRTMHTAFIALSESSDTAVSATTITTACTAVSTSRSNMPDAWPASRVDSAKAYSGHPNSTRFATVNAVTNIGNRQRMSGFRIEVSASVPLRARERCGQRVVGGRLRSSRAARAAPVLALALGRSRRVTLRFTRGRRRIVEASRKRDALALHVDLQHAHLDDVARLDDFARILDVLVRQRRDVDQAVLVHADVDEGAAGGDVADDAFEDHADLEVLDVLHAFGEARGLELGARIAARLFQFLEDVAHGGHAELRVGELLRLEAAKQRGVADQLLHLAPALFQDARDHRVRLGMHRRRVERLVAIGDAQEARALFEGLLAQARHLQQGLAILERAIRVAVVDDVLGDGRRQARHAREQRGGSRVDVHAHRVHAVLHARI